MCTPGITPSQNVYGGVDCKEVKFFGNK